LAKNTGNTNRKDDLGNNTIGSAATRRPAPHVGCSEYQNAVCEQEKDAKDRGNQF
jgi:hypothetical protein